jgi:predicted DNA-binding protein (MmcQ/YjbR family)
VSELTRAVQALRRVALGYPEAVEDFPWGDRTIKVRGKIFLFLGENKETLNLTVKLPDSADAALGLPFTSPTRYRLGRSGWVSARFPKNSEIPLDMFRDWIDESYRAVAPSVLVRKLTPRSPHPDPPPRAGEGKEEKERL